LSLFYVDTSAALKLLVAETHSEQFAAFYDEHPAASWVSSTLLRIEVVRAVTRAIPTALPEARELLAAFDYIRIDDEVVDRAMNEPDRALRSRDAIHLATARLLGDEVEAVVTYDDRLAAAASAAGFTVATPGAA